MDEPIFDKRPEAADYANAHGLIVIELENGKYTCAEPPPAPPDPPVDRTDFDNACAMFRAICTDIGALLGVEFRGGFDEMQAFRSSEVFNTMPGLRLAIE